MSTELSGLINEARRQLEVCNACRYCEGYCSVFPAVHRRRAFADNTITHLANLCHNCRGCYYACQYTEPHEFRINIPQALAGVRQQSWQTAAWPAGFARAFHKSGVAIAGATAVGMVVLMLAIQQFGRWQGESFYGVLSHNVMVSLFIPAFLLPLLLMSVSVRRYVKQTSSITDASPPDGGARKGVVIDALTDAATLKNLSGGHGEGCNFEDKDRFTHTRRWLHHATLYGFLLCFASTSVATLMHYLLNMPAPYPLLSLPKLLGITGGLLLCIGTAGLAILKLKADRHLGAESVWGGEMGFVLLLFLVSASGLLLYWFGGTSALAMLLVIHLGSVLAFFLLMPYTKMMHGFFRLAALVIDRRERLGS